MFSKNLSTPDNDTLKIGGDDNPGGNLGGILQAICDHAAGWDGTGCRWGVTGLGDGRRGLLCVRWGLVEQLSRRPSARQAPLHGRAGRNEVQTLTSGFSSRSAYFCPEQRVVARVSTCVARAPCPR